MDTIPMELLEKILEEYAYDEVKNNVLGARLTCSAFDSILRPLAVATINLDRTRLSWLNPGSLTSFRGLDSIAGSARAIYIDLMSMRDNVEIQDMEDFSGADPQLHAYCTRLRAEFTIGYGAFTLIEYGQYLGRMLSRCRSIEAAWVNLPCSIFGKNCGVVTQILTKTMEVLHARSEPGGGAGAGAGHTAAAAAPIKTLVLENVTGLSVARIFRNQIDMDPFRHAFGGLRNLSLQMRGTEAHHTPNREYSRALWTMIGWARSLETLCLTVVDQSLDAASAGVRRTSLASQVSLRRWRRSNRLPGPIPAPARPIFLRSLELHCVTIMPADLMGLMRVVSASLEELFLSRVLLKADQTAAYNRVGDKILWTGVPNQRPMADDWWIGIEVRRLLRRLQICRATALEYDHFLDDVGLVNQDGFVAPFDCDDPAGLGRSLAQRFVEVALGIEQPAQADDPEGPAIFFLSKRRREDDGLLRTLTPRHEAALRAVDVDSDTFQREVGNPTSRWNEALDGVFPNWNARSLDDVAWAGYAVAQIMAAYRERSGAGGPAGPGPSAAVSGGGSRPRSI